MSAYGFGCEGVPRVDSFMVVHSQFNSAALLVLGVFMSMIQFAPAAESSSVRLDGKTAAERGAALVRYVATVRPAAKDETYPKAAAPCYAARLVLNTDTAYALGKLDAAAAYQLRK